jgi:hypothetical protein
MVPQACLSFLVFCLRLLLFRSLISSLRALALYVFSGGSARFLRFSLGPFLPRLASQRTRVSVLYMPCSLLVSCHPCLVAVCDRCLFCLGTSFSGRAQCPCGLSPRGTFCVLCPLVARALSHMLILECAFSRSCFSRLSPPPVSRGRERGGRLLCRLTWS